MKNKKLLAQIVAGAVGLCITGFLLSVLNGMFGNPLSAALARNKIRAYVAENYAEENFQVPQATYNFKDQSYMTIIQSETSADTRFSVSVLDDGEIYDSYEFDVIEKFNTFRRLEEALDDAVEDLIRAEFPYETRLILASMKDNNPNMFNSLLLDMPFDLYNLPLPVEVVVWTSAEQPDYEVAAQRMLELKALMEANQVAVSTYSLSLEYPYHEENGELRPEIFDSISINDFPAEQLTDSPDLPAILEKHQQAWEIEGNKEKQAEMD
jgi:hypothetical protein